MATNIINSSNEINPSTGVQKNPGNTTEGSVSNSVRLVGTNEPVESRFVGTDFITGTTLNAVDDYQILIDESPANAHVPQGINLTASGITLTPISSTGVFLRDGRHAQTNLTFLSGSGFTPVTSQIGIDIAGTNPAYAYKRGAAPVQSGFF